ncbi:hypothetical protein FB451DRAFT_1250599 [Mycena latifolia]|nr:hypothetical protein FB451DRAFT_1250599 [Mycena latifolia]
MTSETETTETVVAVAAPKKQKKLKPARKQVKPGDVVKTEAPQTGKEYNIWYNKWAGGDREDSYSNKVKSQTRCNIKRDSGLTRANVTGIKYTCLYFARGCCPYGWDSQTTATDMGGVGSFNRQNRTLYIGRIKEQGTAKETEEIVMRHFKEWGQIERGERHPSTTSASTWAVKVLQYRSVAFVTYVSELHAQFAKEAMACQSLDNDEILNVRWATEDPNPVQKVAEKRRLVDMGQEVIKAKIDPKIVDAMRTIRALEDGDVLDEDGFILDDDDVEDDGSGQPGAKRRRLEAPPPSQELEEQPPQPKGLLSADTLEGLKYFAEIRKRNGVPAAPVPRAAPAPLKEGLGLADYGSDDED